MRDELKSESSRGISLRGVTFGQEIFSLVVGCVLTALLIVIPTVL